MPKVWVGCISEPTRVYRRELFAEIAGIHYSKAAKVCQSVPFLFLIFEATAAAGIFSGSAVPSALYLGKFVGTIHIPMLGTVRSCGSTTQPLTLNEPSSAMEIPWTLWVLSHQTLVLAETSIKTL